MGFKNLSRKRKRILGVIGIVVVLGSWALVPSVAALFGFASLDVAFWLTVFYALVWLGHRHIKKRR